MISTAATVWDTNGCQNNNNIKIDDTLDRVLGKIAVKGKKVRNGFWPSIVNESIL